MNRRNVPSVAVAVAVAVAVISCGGGGGGQGNNDDFAEQELTVASLPASPTNASADDPAAAALGQKLFFDRSLSADGTIACVSCHDPKHGFSDPKPRSKGVDGQLGDRHAMPVTAAVYHPFLFWDGRADSAWSQALGPLENPKEMGSTRVEIVHRIATVYASSYETAFGDLPDLSATPARGMPGDPAYDEMPEALKNKVERVFANAGKAIESYERRLVCADTRFDRWVRGEEELTNAELSGAQTFRRQHCDRCHSGPSFSDGAFHDIGIPSLDLGRVLGAPKVLADPFDGAGVFSDDPAAGALKLSRVPRETAQKGAFRTASLRGVGQRTYFGHAAHKETIAGFVLDIYHRGGRGRDRGRDDGRSATVGTLDPRLDDVDVDDDDVDDLIAFLHTLDCPAPPAALLTSE